MAQKTRPDIWKTERPTVIYVVPAIGAEVYASIMNQLTVNVARSLNWDPGTIDLIGLVAASPQDGAEGICFLEQSGIDTRSLTLLVLWGNTADAVEFNDLVSEDCGVGKVILPETGVVLPTVRMPSIVDGWWLDAFHQEYAEAIYARLVEKGKEDLQPDDPHVFVSLPHVWN